MCLKHLQGASKSDNDVDIYVNIRELLDFISSISWKQSRDNTVSSYMQNPAWPIKSF